MSKKDFINFNPKDRQIDCQGNWSLKNLLKLKKSLKKIRLPETKELVVDGKNINYMDSAGAWLLSRWLTHLTKKNYRIELQNFSDQHQKILKFTKTHKEKDLSKQIPKIPKLGFTGHVGKTFIEGVIEFYTFLSFIGEIFFTGVKVIVNPKFWRWNTIIDVINKAGTTALPIIALLSFMIGVVVSYQMGNQLKEYGANLFIVDLIGYSVLREFGPLLTGIMVSGRTGSAFTAQLGLMKVNREIDALDAMGTKAAELLVLPRILALFIVVPLLTIWADIFGVIGGMVMAKNVLHVTWIEFLTRFQREIPLRTLIIGLAKAPLFALVIASIGCFQGMEVNGSAESVGSRTTRSVVLAIFFIIVIDAMISILLSRYKL